MTTTLRRRNGGFTLLELVVVLGILVILATTIVAKLDVLQLRANKGVAASNIAGVSRFVQTYLVANNHYPDGWDSLVDRTAGKLWDGNPTAPATSAPPCLIPSLIGGLAGAPAKFTTTTIANNNELYSLTRMGLENVYDLDATTSLPSDRFTVLKALAVGDVVATINAADSKGLGVLKSFYPPNGTIPANRKVVVFGLGRLNTLVGAKGLLSEPPIYANNPDVTKYYGRLLGVFELDTTGGRCRLLGSLAADGDTLVDEVVDYYKIQ